MKRMKRIISLCLITLMTVSTLAGCAGNSNTANGDKKVFSIGGSGPLTGDYASYGISVKQGAEIAVAEINEAGGVNGMEFKYTILDDEAEAQPAISAYNKLMDEGVDVILGNVTSGSTIAITELTKEDGILQLTPSGSALDCTKYDNAFRICFTDPLQGVTMADFTTNTLGFKNVAILYDVASDYSKGMAEAFIEQLESNGGTIVAHESFTSGDVDFNTQLTTIKSSNAEVLFIPAYYQDVASILNQAAVQELNLPLIGGDGWDGVLGQLEDSSLAEGAIFLSPFIASDSAENVQNFVSKYKEKFGSTPDQFAADAYDGVYVIKAAIEKANSTESADLIKAMTEIEVDGVTGNMTFTPEGEPNKDAKLIVIKNGEYQAYH